MNKGWHYGIPDVVVLIIHVQARCWALWIQGLGDAGSPPLTTGPTSGLNMDDQHDHIWDTVVPTFIHYNIPLLIFGWIAAMIL
ncbi:Na+/H+ antiporter family [Plesiomonas shigelloides]|nr:Na+/H+ antiporter family [Plesiomonas shigelloides]